MGSSGAASLSIFGSRCHWRVHWPRGASTAPHSAGRSYYSLRFTLSKNLTFLARDEMGRRYLAQRRLAFLTEMLPPGFKLDGASPG